MDIFIDDFIETLPANWKHDRFKDIASLRNEKSTDANEEKDYLELEDIESGTGKILGWRNTLEVESAVTVFKKGDILFGKLRPYLEKYYETEIDGKCTGEILAFKPERIFGRFLFYCLASRWFVQRCNALAYGAKMPRVNWTTQLAQFNFPLPPLPEQEHIASYLDTSCAAIDMAVQSKQSQIETLDELRKTAIHTAFAELDKYPIERVKDLTTKIGSGVTPDGGAANYLDSGVPLLRSQNVHFDGLYLDDVAYISEETHASMSNSRLQPKDVLLNITGASIGRCTFVPENFGEGNVNQHVCIVRPTPKIDHRYLASYLSSPFGQDQILSSFTGASRQGLSQKELGLIRLPLPPHDIQSQVVSKIEKSNEMYKGVRDCLEKQIDVLLEYRKSLIHEYVTGQRRVTKADLKQV
jgi:type I restriction enzyme S subunit